MTAIAPATIPIQTQAIDFNNPVGTSTQIPIGAFLNYFLGILLPVGSFLHCYLSVQQFQSQLGTPNPATWILADGSDVTGSAYNTITGSTTIPDMRGVFVRGKNDGRSDGKQNPDGELALGTLTQSKTGGHTHIYQALQQPLQFPGSNRVNLIIDNPGTFNTTAISSLTGGLESVCKNLTLNTFIRIN